jgi:formate dehydrogenase major subunit
LLAVSRYLLENGLAHTEFLNQWVNGLDEYKESLAPFTMEWAVRTCGISEDMLKKVAHLIAE